MLSRDVSIGNTEDGLEEIQTEDRENGTTVRSLSSEFRRHSGFVQSPLTCGVMGKMHNLVVGLSIVCPTPSFLRKVPMALKPVREGKGRVRREVVIYRGCHQPLGYRSQRIAPGKFISENVFLEQTVYF